MEKVVKLSRDFDFNGHPFVVEWVRYIVNGREHSDYWLVINRKNADGSLTEVKDDEEKRGALEVAVAARIEELRQEYSGGARLDKATALTVAENVLNRVWNGEWLGQRGYGYFIDDLADLFGTNFMAASQMVEELRKKQIAGLNGFIIIPWEEEEEAFRSWEKATGHKRLLVGDWSGWHCQHCLKSADERGPSAKDVPCERPTFRGVEI